MNSADVALWEARYITLVGSHGILSSGLFPNGTFTFVLEMYCEFFTRSGGEFWAL